MTEAFALTSHFVNKKYWQTSDINIRNLNETLIHDVISFEQPGPAFSLVLVIRLASINIII